MRTCKPHVLCAVRRLDRRVAFHNGNIRPTRPRAKRATRRKDKSRVTGERLNVPISLQLGEAFRAKDDSAGAKNQRRSWSRPRQHDEVRPCATARLRRRRSTQRHRPQVSGSRSLRIHALLHVKLPRNQRHGCAGQYKHCQSQLVRFIHLSLPDAARDNENCRCERISSPVVTRRRLVPLLYFRTRRGNLDVAQPLDEDLHP